MASIREIAREVIDDAINGIAWIALWKIGRSWNAKTFYTEYWNKDNMDGFSTEDLEEFRKIVATDPRAILVNGYYCNLGDTDCMTIESLANALRWQYGLENSFLLANELECQVEADGEAEPPETKEVEEIHADKENTKMTRYEIAEEIERLTLEGKKCKNSFRMQCIAQEIVRLEKKLEEIDFGEAEEIVEETEVEEAEEIIEDKKNAKMKYEMVVDLTDPETPKGMTSDLLMKLTCTFAHDPKQYGNGYSLLISSGDGFGNIIDLRYDTTFNPDQKTKYLEKWARKYWSGKDGAYTVKSLKISATE